MRVSILGMKLSTFGLAVVLFTTPFVTISCPGLTLSLTGLQLVGGTTLSEPQMFGPAKERAIEGEPVAALILLCAIAGFTAAFLSARPGRALGGIAGLLGVLLLLFLKAKIEGDVARQAMGLFQARFGFGYWGVLMAMAGGLLSNVFLKPDTKTAAIEPARPEMSSAS